MHNQNVASFNHRVSVDTRLSTPQILPDKLSLMDIKVPFSEWVNPQAYLVQPALTNFVDRWNIKLKHFKAHCAVNAYMFPRAEPLHLIETGKAMLFGFFIDEVFDVAEPSVSKKITDITGLRDRLAKTIPSIFATGELPSNPLGFEYSALETVEKFLTTPDQDWAKRFKHVMVDYVEKTVQGREQLHAYGLSLDEYLHLRASDCGVLFSCALIEFANQAYLAEDTWHHPLIQELTYRTCYTLGILNDIFSYHREALYEQKTFNAIGILMQNENLTLEQTFNRLVIMVNDYLAAFVETSKQIEDHPDPAVKPYIQGLREFISTGWYWHLACGRYHTANSPFIELNTQRATPLAE